MIKIVFAIASLALFLGSINTETVQQAEQNPLKAYVLTDASGKVVGTGGIRIGALDLKWEKPSLIKKYDLPASVTSKLTPYYGVSGEQAIKLLKEKPLQLTQSEYDLVNQKVKAFWLAKYQGLSKGIQQNPKVVKLVDLANNNKWVQVLEQIDQLAQQFFKTGTLNI